MKIRKKSNKFPFMELIIEADGKEYELNLNDTFKIIVIFVLIGFAYNLGAYIELETLKTAQLLCNGGFSSLNISFIP